MYVNAYIHFQGNCEEAFRFYAQATGGTIEAIHTYEGSPMAERTPPDFRKKVMHARMSIGGTPLMGSDAVPERSAKSQGFSICLEADSPAEADRIFAALSQGGAVEMPMQKTFWSARFGMFTDKFGISWLVNCDKGE